MEQWTTVRFLRTQGRGIREIAREVGVSRQAVRRALEDQERPRYSRRKGAGAKLDPYRATVEELFLRKQLIGTRIYKEIKAAGYEGGRTMLYDFLRSLRQTAISEKATERFETEPGQQGQFDWSPYTVALGAEERQVIVFALTLGYSRRKHYSASLDERGPSIFEAIEDALWHFGGAPRELLVDNARALVTRHTAAELIFNDQFLELCGHYRIQPRACRPYRPRTKGKVERPFAYLEQHFIKGNTWRSFDHFRQELASFEREDLDTRVHGTTRQTPLARFATELPGLTPLPERRFVGVRSESRKVSWDCLVSFRANRYSVPAVYAGSIVWLRVSRGEQLVILSSTHEPIAEHAIRPGKGEIVIVPEHYALLRQREGARTFAVLRQQFLERFPHDGPFLEGLVAQCHSSPVPALREILALVDLYPEATLRSAFASAAEHRHYSHVFVRGIVEHQASPQLAQPPPEPALALPHSAVIADLGRYQQVLELSR